MTARRKAIGKVRHKVGLAAKEKARLEVEEAKKAKEAEEKAKKDAELAAKEKARLEAEEAKKAKEAEDKAKKDAELAAKARAPGSRTTPSRKPSNLTLAPDNNTIMLTITTPMLVRETSLLQKELEKIIGVKITATGGEARTGTFICVSLDRPIYLIPYLNKMSLVAGVSGERNRLMITLKPYDIR